MELLGQRAPSAMLDSPSTKEIHGEKLCQRGQNMDLKVKAGFESSIKNCNHVI